MEVVICYLTDPAMIPNLLAGDGVSVGSTHYPAERAEAVVIIGRGAVAWGCLSRACGDQRLREALPAARGGRGRR